MQAVGRILGQGVMTVSGPFHPFGGAVDIIVVVQPDGSYKSSPWYVRFGKFQGVLKTREKLVGISVNGVEADFLMHLDHRGQAHFWKEVDTEEVESVCSPPSSSGEDTEVNCEGRGPLKSKSCNSDVNVSDPVVNGKDGNTIPRTNSRRSRIMGFVLGRRSVKETAIPDEENAFGVVRTDSIERAEIAADLLELKWSTNLTSSRLNKDNLSQSSAEDTSKDVYENSAVVGCTDDETCLVSDSSYQEMDSNFEENGTEMKCITAQYVIETATSTESVEEDATLANTEPLTFTENLGEAKEDYDIDSQTVSETLKSNSQNQGSVEKQSSLSDTSFSTEENGADTRHCFYHSETSESSRVGLEESIEKDSFCCRGCAEERVHAEAVHSVTKLVSEVKSDPERDVIIGHEALNIQDYLGNEDHIILFHKENIPTNQGTLYSAPESIITGSNSQAVHLHPSDDPIREDVSLQVVTNSSSRSSDCTDVDERTTLGGDQLTYGSFAGALSDPQISSSDCVATYILSSEVSKEEQLLFGDMDDIISSQATCVEFTQVEDEEKKAESLLSGRVSGEFIESSHAKCCPSFSLDQSVINDYRNGTNLQKRRLRTISSDNNINTAGGVKSYELTRRVKSFPSMSPLSNNFDGCDLGRSGVILGENKDYQSPSTQSVAEVVKIIKGSQEGPANPPIENPPKPIESSSRRSWSFSFKRSMKVSPPATVDSESSNATKILKSTSDSEGVEDVKKVKASKKKVMMVTPTSEQLASLNLKEGKNVVVFTFSTAMLGKQQVDARIFLWKWDTRIVISDVDGTITRSDLLGQVMPLVGMDWSQSGVAHLFSAIKENGYQMIFLSARAISQAFHTRQFLFNIKQDGKAMPDGPVVISPDGLFPSLFREVVRRAPHEFKIACLQDIKALFPADTSPFYAGFGNRDTDEFSYLKVGIPKNKIFIINTKGEIVVNRRIDTKSYSSLHGLVHGMFPSKSSSEKEDFNSWNFWKLPPPIIDV